MKTVDLVEKSALVHPRCIACDDEDNIYCIDEESNKNVTSTAISVTSTGSTLLLDLLCSCIFCCTVFLISVHAHQLIVSRETHT